MVLRYGGHRQIQNVDNGRKRLQPKGKEKFQSESLARRGQPPLRAMNSAQVLRVVTRSRRHAETWEPEL